MSLEETLTLARVRRFLLGTLLVGLVGTGGELLLIGHFESLTQFIPLVLLSLGLCVIAWHLLSPGARSLTVLQLIMALFVASGGLGVGLHYHGNQEFELELHPSAAGFELIRATLSGATPILAPGSMALLGFVGLIYTYRHPSLRPGAFSTTQE